MFYARPGQDGTHPRELRTNHHKGTQPKNEKGGWCKPPSSLELTPQNRIPVEVGIRPPREANLFKQRCHKREQTVCQRLIRNSYLSSRMKQRELVQKSRFRTARPPV